MSRTCPAWSSPLVRAACGLHTIGYHYLIPLADNAYGMARIAAALDLGASGRSRGAVGVGRPAVAGTPAAQMAPSAEGGSIAGQVVPRLGRRHVVSKSDKRALSGDAMALLARVYMADMNLLQFHAASNWSSAHSNTSSAYGELTRRPSSSGSKGRGKGKGKGKGRGGVGAIEEESKGGSFAWLA